MNQESLNRILSKFNITSLNNMQMSMSKTFDKGVDAILIAPTGSGKTLAFLLPVLSKIQVTKEKLLVIAPSRELVLQIENVARTMAMGLKIVACYGGHPAKIEATSLSSGYDIVIGTPGRLTDHIRRKNIDGIDFKYCVLDEFDKTLEIGFHEELEYIMSNLIKLNQKILTSATQAQAIPDYITLYNPFIIHEETETLKSKLMLWRVISPIKDKLSTLKTLALDLLPSSMIVFCNYKESAERVSHYLKEEKVRNDIFHGGLDQIQRELVLSKFRNGSTKILVATDLASRGLDIPLVSSVIHYHLPMTEEEFIHRNGRTARMGAEGSSYIIQYEEENLPEFIKIIPDIYYPLIKEKQTEDILWTTLKINRGKEDKISKGDVMGFFGKNYSINKDDVGKIEVKDRMSLVAVKANNIKSILHNKDAIKIKGKSVKIEQI